MATTTAVPVHVLMLPRGSNADVPAQAQSGPADKKRADDDAYTSYLEKRHAYRLSKARDAMLGESEEEDGTDDDGGDASDVDVVVPLREMCSPLEIAIASCCDGDGIVENPSSSSEEEKALLPSDADGGSSSAMEESGSSGSDTGSDANHHNKGGKRKRGRESITAIGRGAISAGSEGRFASLIARHCHTAADRALALAVLRRTVERDDGVASSTTEERSRSGAQAAKKRRIGEGGTEQREQEQVDGEKSGGGGGSDANDSNDGGATTTASAQTNDGSSTPSAAASDEQEKDNRGRRHDDGKRMANFLSAGGLKVLNQWLIEASTPIPPPPPAPGQPKQQQQQHGSKRRRRPSPAEEQGSGKQPKPKTSPTGPILIPLLEVLRSMPFRKDLVVDIRINKRLRDLKRSLDKLVSSFRENGSGSDEESSGSSSDNEDERGGSSRSSGSFTKKKTKKKRTLDELTHPLSGGMPVVEVQRDVQKLMDTWRDAAKDAAERERGASANGTDGNSKDGSGAAAAATVLDPPVDFYANLRAKMAERFEVLSKYEAGEISKPEWLERLDPTKKRRAAAPATATATAAKLRPEEQKRQAEADRRMMQTQAELKAAQAARLEAKEKMEQYRKRMREKRDKAATAELELGQAGGRKQRGETEQVVQQQQPLPPPPQKAAKKERTRRVTWVDQKSAAVGDARARPLAEVREFVRETDVYQSEEEDKRGGQDSEDESDERLEEDDYDDCDYDEETQASDSVDSDDFDSIPYNEEDANFSQEEEAGFTFETQELGKDKSADHSDSSKKDDEADGDDGWATYTYNL